MVLIAQTTAGHSLAFAVSEPATPDDLDRLRAIQSMPGLDGATWTMRSGYDVR